MPSILNIRRLTLLSAAAVMWGTGCVAHAMSPADCAAEADRASRDQGSTMGGAARGAVRGGAFGAIVGGDAGRGAAVGAVVGGARTANQKNNTYRRVYDDCMRRR